MAQIKVPESIYETMTDMAKAYSIVIAECKRLATENETLKTALAKQESKPAEVKE